MLKGSYNWDRYPLAPPGCKAVIYKIPAVQGSSRASRGTDAGYLGPSADHYWCNLYYVPETRAYRILVSAKLFPQHCQVPNLCPNAHLKALTKELQTAMVTAAGTPKGRHLIKSLAMAIKVILTPIAEEQRVATDIVNGRHPSDPAPIMTKQQILDAQEIIQTRNPTAMRNLITMACIHQRQTQNNTPGALPKITQAQPALIQPDPCQTTTDKQGSTRIRSTTSPVIIIPPGRVPGEVRASARLISQQALTAMTEQEALTMPISFTPHKLVPATCSM